MKLCPSPSSRTNTADCVRIWREKLNEKKRLEKFIILDLNQLNQVSHSTSLNEIKKKTKCCDVIGFFCHTTYGARVFEKDSIINIVRKKTLLIKRKSLRSTVLSWDGDHFESTITTTTKRHLRKFCWLPGSNIFLFGQNTVKKIDGVKTVSISQKKNYRQIFTSKDNKNVLTLC